MDIEVLQSDAQFASLRQSWNQLTDQPLLSWQWHYSWWRNQGDEDQLALIVAREHDRVVAIAPMMIESRGGERCLRFLGSGSTCTDYLQLIVAAGAQLDFPALVADAIVSGIEGLRGVTLIELEGITDDVDHCALHACLEPHFWGYDKRLDSTWVLELPDTWQAFVQTRSKSLRRKLKKAEKRYSSGEARVKSTRGQLQFEDAFQTLVELHQRRFESKGQPGVFADTDFKQFLLEATSALAAEQRAEISVCEIEGRPIVAQLYLTNDRQVQMYQSGVCDQSMRYEPGHLLFTHTIRNAIEAGKKEFDFLRGNEPYKKYWGATECPLFNVRLVANGFSSTLKHQVIRGLRSVKSMVRTESNEEH